MKNTNAFLGILLASFLFLALWLKSQWRKILKIGIGVSIFQIVNKIGIAFINPLIVFSFNTWWALLIMFIVSVLIRLSFIILYDKFKIDWFFIEKLKEMQLNGKKIEIKNNKYSFQTKAIMFLSKYGKLTITLFLCTYDPFLLVIFVRKGSFTWNNIPDLKTFGLFLISCLVCSIIAFSWIKPTLELLKVA